MIETYRERFPEIVIGLSDHQSGIAMTLVAYMLGARVIEKHFTLDHAWKGSDHAFSLMPEGMRRLVRDLHGVHRDRRRAEALAAERATTRSKRWGRSWSQRPGSFPQGMSCRRMTSLKSPADGGLPPYRLDDLIGMRLLRPLAPGGYRPVLDVELAEEPVTAPSAHEA